MSLVDVKCLAFVAFGMFGMFIRIQVGGVNQGQVSNRAQCLTVAAAFRHY
jgi:hypothetical protein